MAPQPDSLLRGKASSNYSAFKTRKYSAQSLNGQSLRATITKRQCKSLLTNGSLNVDMKI